MNSTASPTTLRSVRTPVRARSAQLRPATAHPVPFEDIDNLMIRIAAGDDSDRVAELVARSGASRPEGGLLLAFVDERVLAAASVASRATVSEPTPAGHAAAAVLRYRIAERARRTNPPRRIGSPS